MKSNSDPKDSDLPTSRLAPSSGISSILQSTSTSDMPRALPSALATARHIEDINHITYPEGINTPKAELNVNNQNGKFLYDRDFLLQFMNICKEKPDNLPPLDVIGLDPRAMPRGGTSRNRTPSGMPPPVNARPASIGLGIASGSGKSLGRMSSEQHPLATSTGRRDRVRSKRGASNLNCVSVLQR
ncbi:eukaryotic translation initiation factor 4G1, eIF4E-binding domain-containing protein [Lactarius quietus]|nr:eukaryotic translation initiation factor 4G1, eIF4E-binding domain-containing protein [Lactarius quietus]